MNRAVLFDFDDTLVDFRPTDPNSLFEAGAARVYACLTTLGCSLPAFEVFCRQQRRIARRIAWMTWLSGGEPDCRRILRRLCRDYGLQRDENSLAKLGWFWYEPIAETASLADDVIPTLQALRQANVKLGLVANTTFQGEIIDRHLDLLGLLEFFPVRAYSSELASGKPHPSIFKSALKELHARASEAIFVGNDPAMDIGGAHRVGMQTVLRSANPSRRARRQADHVIARIGQLTDVFDVIPETSSAGMSFPPLKPALS